MKVDILVAEIGSTTTLINAFDNMMNDKSPYLVGQGLASTTVTDGDVTIGLNKALQNLKDRLGIKELDYKEFYGTSSAAGGLKMTVHGLVHDMTAKAAKEAALGAGANLHMITSGRLSDFDLIRLKEIGPNIILVAGGVDHGERQTALDHIKKIISLKMDVPIIYAGNKVNADEVSYRYKKAKTKGYLVDNVYPHIDQLNIEPTRKVIQEVFENHITKAPGMTKVTSLVNKKIMPTPGAVMEATKLLKSVFHDLMTIDVGGATTDIHSVTEGSDDINKIRLNPEPIAKRTVEGDMGVYLNQKNIVEELGKGELVRFLNTTENKFDCMVKNYKGIPSSPLEIDYICQLTKKAMEISVDRHCGVLRDVYTGKGKKTIIDGKDLSQVKVVIGTGGALTKLPRGQGIIKEVIRCNKSNLLLPEEVLTFIDYDYIMASVGVLASEYPEKATKLMLKSLSRKACRGGAMFESQNSIS